MSSFYCLENQLNSALLWSGNINSIKLVLLPKKLTEFSSLYCQENQLNCSFSLLGYQLIFVAGKSVGFSLFSGQAKVMNLVNFPAMKMSCNKMIFQPRKRAEFNQFSRRKNELNSVDFLSPKMSWYQLVFCARNPLRITSFSVQEILSKSAQVLG